MLMASSSQRYLEMPGIETEIFCVQIKRSTTEQWSFLAKQTICSAKYNRFICFSLGFIVKDSKGTM